MGAYGTTFALVGGTFAVVDCLVEDFRGMVALHWLFACNSTRPMLEASGSRT